MANKLGHFEIHAEDPERCGKFYSDVFGWTITKWEGGQFEYWMVMNTPVGEAGGINGGIVRRVGPGPGETGAINGMVGTIIVDAFDVYAEKILAHGGVVALPKMALIGMAWQGYFKDTEGNVFGLHQADTDAK